MSQVSRCWCGRRACFATSARLTRRKGARRTPFLLARIPETHDPEDSSVLICSVVLLCYGSLQPPWKASELFSTSCPMSFRSGTLHAMHVKANCPRSDALWLRWVPLGTTRPRQAMNNDLTQCSFHGNVHRPQPVRNVRYGRCPRWRQ